MTPWLYQLFGSAANLVLKNDILEILRQSRDGQHVCFPFYVPLGHDEFVEGFRLVPDRAKVTGRKLALSSIRVGRRCLLEQLCPPLVLEFLPGGTPEFI